MIKSILIISLSLLSFTACSVPQIKIDKIEEEKISYEREPVNNELLNRISYITFLLKQNALETINKELINPKYGIYEVYKDENTNKITFNHIFKLNEISNYFDSFNIRQEENIFNCSPYDDAYYGWIKEGVFLSPKTKNYLSTIMKKENLIQIDKYKEDELQRIKLIEKTSYEIIITYNMVFYLTKIDNKWYITLIDKLKTDCSQ